MYSRNALNSYEAGNTARRTVPETTVKRRIRVNNSNGNGNVKAQVKKAPAIVNYDFWLLYSIVLLFGVGLMFIYSGAQYTTISSQNAGMLFFFKQLKIGGAGLGAAIVLSLLGYKWIGCEGIIKGFFKGVLKKGWIIFCGYLLSVGLLVATLIHGESSHGKSRWISILGAQIQPAELAKIAIIVTVAFMISTLKSKVEWRNLKWRIAAVTAVPVVLIMFQNISSAIIVGLIAAAMVFAAEKNTKAFAIGGIAAVAGYFGSKPLLSFIIHKFNITERPEQYFLRRIFAWACPEIFEADYYQTKQGLYAIGSGGLTGHGIGESIQKFGKIPEVQNDMIFTIICEETGFLGATLLFIAFGLLLFRIYKTAVNSKDYFGSFLCTGVLAHIGIQIIMNIAVVTGSMPNTGVTLPFISYGGTAILCTMIEMGLVLGVASRSLKQ